MNFYQMCLYDYEETITFIVGHDECYSQEKFQDFVFQASVSAAREAIQESQKEIEDSIGGENCILHDAESMAMCGDDLVVNVDINLVFDIVAQKMCSMFGFILIQPEVSVNFHYGDSLVSMYGPSQAQNPTLNRIREALRPDVTQETYREMALRLGIDVPGKDVEN